MQQASTELPRALWPLVAADVVRIKAGADYSRTLENHRVWVKAVEGRLYVCGTGLRAGEGRLLERETVLAAYAETDSLILIVELGGNAP